MKKAVILLAVAGLSLAKKEEVTGSTKTVQGPKFIRPRIGRAGVLKNKVKVADDEDLWKVSLSGGKKADDEDLWKVTLSGGKKADDEELVAKRPFKPSSWLRNASEEEIEALIDELWKVTLSGGKKADDEDLWKVTLSGGKKADDEELWKAKVGCGGRRADDEELIANRRIPKSWLKNASEEEIEALIDELWKVTISGGKKADDEELWKVTLSGGKKKADDEELIAGPSISIPRSLKDLINRKNRDKKKADDEELIARLPSKPFVTKPWINRFKAADDQEAEAMIDELWKVTISGGKKKADDEELWKVTLSGGKKKADDDELAAPKPLIPRADDEELWKVSISGGKKKADDEELVAKPLSPKVKSQFRGTN